MSYRGSTRLSVTVILLPTGKILKTVELEHERRPHLRTRLVRIFLEAYATRFKVDATVGAPRKSPATMIQFRIPRQVEMQMRKDFARAHSFACERVGFIYTRVTRSVDNNTTLILGSEYNSVPDDDYIDDDTVGARINSRAIRRVMQRVLNTGEGAFHVHLHEHGGLPHLSHVDREELRPMMASIKNAAPQSAHGLLLLSHDASYAEVLVPHKSQFQRATTITTVGFPMNVVAVDEPGLHKEERFSRQSFLGNSATESIRNYRVGIVGLGGGGSHVAQQLAHLGFSKFSLFDSDIVEISNLNRLVGGTEKDARRATAKVEVAARLVKGVNPAAKLVKTNARWQESPDRLRECDLVFGCVDSFAERRDLEIATRRYLIPYLDIGLDVHQSGEEPPRMAGQVILSMPGELCMTCLGFLTEAKLAREAEQYGGAGPRPQVVWANGILASSAVGIAMDLLTDWTRSLRGPIYLSYDSNTCCVQPHKRLEYLAGIKCPHFPFSQIGDPTFSRL